MKTKALPLIAALMLAAPLLSPWSPAQAAPAAPKQHMPVLERLMLINAAAVYWHADQKPQAGSKLDLESLPAAENVFTDSANKLFSCDKGVWKQKGLIMHMGFNADGTEFIKEKGSFRIAVRRQDDGSYILEELDYSGMPAKK